MVYHDFALVWQPVAPWIRAGPPLLMPRASLCYSVVLDCFSELPLCGRFACCSRTYCLIPAEDAALVVAPQIEAVWLGLGELLVLLAGGWFYLPDLLGCEKDRR